LESKNPDPDPAFKAKYRSEFGSGYRGFDEQKLKILAAEKKINIFGSKIAIHLSLGLHKGRHSYRISLQPSIENIQHFKNMKFLNFFLFLWVTFGLLDQDPDSESRSGSTDLIESGSNPDLKHCFKFKVAWRKPQKTSNEHTYLMEKRRENLNSVVSVGPGDDPPSSWNSCRREKKRKTICTKRISVLTKMPNRMVFLELTLLSI
jgi:hypothetical protein